VLALELRESIEVAHEAQQPRGLLAVDEEPTADLSATTDLADEGDARTTDLTRADDLPRAPMPKQRALGFFAFVACALTAVFLTAQRPAGPSTANAEVAKTPPAHKIQRIPAAAIPAHSREKQKVAEAPATQSAERKPIANQAQGVVRFESRTFVTSEKAVAAVFIVQRTQAVKGRAAVQWSARSGSADAGIDFSDASGTVRFADGQRQLAIYVPLRNDLLKEEDETFKVCLRAPRQARIGGKSCAEVTIRDDDQFFLSPSDSMTRS
jgi:hypothetical protein